MSLMQILKSKTIWTGIASIATGVGIAVEINDWSGVILAVFGLVQIVLRFYTDKPLSAK
jgi:uncharacterized membrane-anchored protein